MHNEQTAGSDARLNPIPLRWSEIAINVAAACLFAYFMYPRVEVMIEHLSAGRGDNGRVFWYVDRLVEILTVAFMSLVILLFLARRPPVRRDSSVLVTIVLLAGILFFCGPIPKGTDIAAHNYLFLVPSRALHLTGMGLSILSLAVLGRCFGVRPEARGLVTRGPYSVVRHPLYLGEMLFWIGEIIARPSLAFFGLFLVLAGMQYWRALMEESVLESAFPEYAAYRARTYRLIPLLH